MNVAAFIEYLNKTKGLQIDASYYAKIEKWRQWWQGYVPSVHNIKITREDGEHKRRRRPCGCPSACARTGQICCSTTRPPSRSATPPPLPTCWAAMNSRPGGLLRQLHFWENANKLVEKAYWSGTGAFVLSVEGIKGTDGQLEADPGCPHRTGLRPGIRHPAHQRGARHRDRSRICIGMSDRRQALRLSADPHGQGRRVHHHQRMV